MTHAESYQICRKSCQARFSEGKSYLARITLLYYFRELPACLAKQQHGSLGIEIAVLFTCSRFLAFHKGKRHNGNGVTSFFSSCVTPKSLLNQAKVKILSNRNIFLKFSWRHGFLQEIHQQESREYKSLLWFSPASHADVNGLEKCIEGLAPFLGSTYQSKDFLSCAFTLSFAFV